MMYLVVNNHVLKDVWEDLYIQDTSSDVNSADLKESLSIPGPLGFMESILNTLKIHTYALTEQELLVHQVSRLHLLFTI